MQGQRRQISALVLAIGLGVGASACRTPPRTEAHATSAARPRAIVSRSERDIPAASAVHKAGEATAPPPPRAAATKLAPMPDSAALVPQSAFPACPAGTTLRRRRAAEDGRESLSCARVQGARVTWHGPSWSWFEGERLSRIDDYRDGVKHGQSLLWFRSGVRRREGQFSHGKRAGTWREFHQNGALAEEASYDHGKLQGLRHRFFESGRKSLEANYDQGVPTGIWSAFYDRDPPNLALTAALKDGREEHEVAGSLPDGTPWKSAPMPDECQEGTECHSPLVSLDLEALPPLLPEPCTWGRGLHVSGNQLAQVTQATRNAWPKTDPPENSLGPRGCVERIKLSCAPDLDQQAGSEVLAEIEFRIYQAECFSSRARSVSPSMAVVALSPPRAGSPAWSARGVIGYHSFDAPGVEGLSLISGVGFVRLPNGEAGVRSIVTTDGGDCSGRRVDQILLLRSGSWVTVTSRTLNECNQQPEPEDGAEF